MRRRAPAITRAAGEWRLWGVVVALAAWAGMGAAGCARSLFGKDELRTQYDRFDQARNELPPAYIENEFGRFEPNLRGRLSRGG